MLKALLIACLRFYRFFLSPWIGQQCRFTPTCSLYAIEAIKRHGVWHGLGLAARRVGRCQPWSPGGYDAVPPICSTSDASRCTHCHRTERD